MMRYMIALYYIIYSYFKNKNWFYLFLKYYVNDLESAKKFYRLWCNRWDEKIPFLGFFGRRSMAYHVSMIIEGYEDNPSKSILTNYMATKYGSEIYFC